MKSSTISRKPIWTLALTLLAALLVALPAASAQAPSRVVGTISGISGNTLTVKTDAGQTYEIAVPATAMLKRIEPGQRTLSGAATIQFSELANGDRALIRMDPNAAAGTLQALEVIAVKESDLAKKQAQEREDWQIHGGGGLVKSVDAATGVIVLSSGSGATAKTITVHTTKDTILKRYAPASVRYDEAKPAPIDAIHPGDQLRARGVKNGEGTEISAAEVISGSFRDISGRISSLDAANSTLVVKDLATKKEVTIHVKPDTQMRRLPERMAQFLAMRLKGGSEGGNGGRGGFARGGGSAGQGGEAGRGMGAGAGPGSEGRGAGAMDPQQMLNRAPEIKLNDLQKGEAVMLVSTQGASDVTAITLIAGVEPLLQSSAASQDLLANWSMSTDAGASATAAP